MKKISLIIIAMFLFSSAIFSQDKEDAWFDFWVGKWQATWSEGEGKVGRGTNTIAKTLNNVVIQENFQVSEGASKGYLGTSISVYNPTKKTWHQGYADTQGAYFNLVGERQGDKRIFKMESVTPSGKHVIQRMVFYEIKDNSFTWDWEASEDNGSTWKLNWRINYFRITQ